MAIQNLSFEDLLASAQRASSSPFLNMGPPSPTGLTINPPITTTQPQNQSITLRAPTSNTLTLSPTAGQNIETIKLPLPSRDIPFEELVQATVQPQPPTPTTSTTAQTTTVAGRSPQKYNNWAKTLKKPLFNSYDDVIKQINSEIEPGSVFLGGGWDFEVVPPNVRNQVIGSGPQFITKFGGTVTDADLKKLFVDNTGVESPDALYAWYVDRWGLRGPVLTNTYDDLMIKAGTAPEQDMFGVDNFLIENLNQIKNDFKIDQQTLEVVTQLQAADQKIKYQNALGDTNINELLANIAKTSLEAKGVLDAQTRSNLDQFSQDGVALLEERRKIAAELGKRSNSLAFVLGLGSMFFAPYLGPKIGAAVGLSGTAAAAVGGGLLGGGIAAVTGGDIAKGAFTGALGSIGTNTYAADVGKALGVTGAAAPIVGNAIINSGISGLIASATGGNVEKSMLTGALVGGTVASAPQIANTLLGGEANVQSIATSLGMELLQTQEIIATSIADAIIAEAQGVDGFGSALGKSLIGRGVSTVAANQAVNLVSNNITQDPQSLRIVFDATRGTASVAVNAALNNQNVGDALKFAAPSIILQAGLNLIEAPQTEADQIAQIIEEQLQTGGLSGQGVQVAAGDGVSGLASVPPELQAEITKTEEALANAEEAYEDNPDASTLGFIRDTENYLSGLYDQVSGATAGFDFRDFSADRGGQGYALVGGGGYAPSGNVTGWNFIGFDSAGNQQFDVGGESFTLFVLPNIKMLASNSTQKVFYPDIIQDPETNTSELVLTPTNVEQVQVDATLPESERPKPVKLQAGEEAEDEEGATGAEGAEGARGTPGGAAPGTLQEALRLELNLLESRLQNTAQERNETQNNLNRALEQREKLREQGLLTALGPDLQDMLDAEIATLEEQVDALNATESSLGTRISDIGASQQGEDGQEGDRGRPSSEVIGDLVQGGFGTGLPGDEGAGTGGLGGGFGPGAGEEGDKTGSGVEGEGPGSGTEGFGPGAGREGEGTGGGGEGEGGAGEDISPLRPVTIFDSPDGRPATPFASRVTGEALAGILGAKEPLFGGDPDEQRAVWNRRSLRLRRALGL